MSEVWKGLVAEKRARQQEKIPKEWIIAVPSNDVLDVSGIPEQCGLLSPKEIEITNSNIDTLLSRLAKAEWSSVEVTTAFSKRAIVAHQLTNCLTEIFIEEALSRAAELDEHLKNTGEVVGPLHGLPVSLKDQISIKGLETTMGYVSWIGKYAEKNAVLADILLQSGAVFYVRTNIPQTLMWPETFNNIFGRTTNPYNRSLTSGGSSGGEGALIALRGSPLGVGSDVGGSVRIPSAFCGIYGFRPSFGRIPYAGAMNSLEGQESVASVFGPLSNSISGLKIFVKSVLSQEPWLKDAFTIRKGWSEEGYNLVDHGKGEKLCFGIMWNDGDTVPHPPILRGLELVKKALTAAGHKVVDWVPLNHKKINTNLGAIWAAGAGEDYQVTTASTGEPIITSMDPNVQTDAPSESNFREAKTGTTAYQLWQLHKEKRDLRQDYLNHWQNTINATGTGRPVDAIISPVAPYAAPPHGMNKNANYTMVWNSLDYPAVVVPVTTVDQKLDHVRFNPGGTFLSKADQANYEQYEPSKFLNAPVAVQVVGRTLEEEAIIAISELVDTSVKKIVQSARL